MNDWSSRPIWQLVNRLESAGLLRRITTKVSPRLEISEITHRVAKEKGPALLFEDVDGSDIPLLINIFGTQRTLELGVGRSIDAQTSDIVGHFIAEGTCSPDLGATIEPADYRDWQELNSLDALPIMQGWPGDGGLYITLPLVYTRDPRTGVTNCGVYRMQVLDGRTTCIHWQAHSDGFRNCRLHAEAGRRMDVAVGLGCEPALVLAAAMGLPHGVSETTLAGLLRGAAVPLHMCRSVDLAVPVAAEIVLEGTVDPSEVHAEGPFGDYTGYYSADDAASVFRIKEIRHRPHPLYTSTLIGKPSLEFVEMMHFLHKIKLGTKSSKSPDIVDYWAPPEGAFTNFGFIALRKRYPGHAVDTIKAIWKETKRPSRVKILIAFDDDVNVRDLREIVWQLGSNIDPIRDVFFGDGPLDDLDHSSRKTGWGSKMGIDATSKWPEENHARPWPNKINMTREIRDMVDRRWRDYFPFSGDK